MAKFSIIDATTGAVKYSGTPKYTGSYCKVSVLEFTEISSPTPINWKVGDYVVYNGTGRTGLTYRLYDIPQPKKQARNAQYGGGFVYSNVQFFADTKWLDIEPFRDLVPEDNNIHFTTQASWSVWTNAANLIDRFNAVMQTAHPGEWEFRLVNATAGSDLYKLLHDTWFEFTISGENVLQGLTKLYDLCGNIGWVHSVENGKNIITVGIPPVYTAGIGTVTELYKYGIGNGLKDIRKSTTNREELKTRLFAYGSTRNMISRYYNNITPAIKDNDSVYIPNLMLPLSQWGTTEVDGVEKKDASKAYIENNVSEYGLRPGTVYFDGSNGNREIYPSLEETTIGELKLAMQSTDPYYPIAGKHADTVRLDEIEAVSGITDDGQKSTAGEKYQYSETKNTQAFSEQRLSGGLQYFDETLVSFSATHGGNLSLDLSKVSPTITDTGATIKSISLFLRVVCGTKVSDYAATWVKSGSVYTLSLPNASVSCANGDAVVLRVVGTIDSNATQGANIAIAASASTILAEYATQSANTKDTFIITIPQIGFDISKRAALGSQGIATISMKDGKCGGRSFVVKSCRYNSTLDSWELTLYRGIDESLDTLFPNTTYPIAQGDHYVLLDIAMPDTYIGMAEQKLLAEATALLADISVPKPFYEPSIDAKYMVDNNRTLMEGRYMQLQDTDIIDGTEYVLIDTLVINEGESNIPTYKVTLREKKRVEYSTSQSVSSGSLTSLASNNEVRTTVAPTAPANDYFEYDPDTHTLIVKKDGNYDVNFAAYGEVTGGGVGEGGGAISGIDRIYFGQQMYKAEEGSLAIHIPLTGTNGIKGVLGITALEEAIVTAGKVDDVKVDGVSVVTNKVANISLTPITDRLDAIEGLIPTQATTSNQLADKGFVNSSVQTATANFRGNWSTWANVPTSANDYPADYYGNKKPTVNDYLVVADASGYGSSYEGTWRFKYSGNWDTLGKNGWLPEYRVNESPMTAAQLAAINSGITDTLVANIHTHSNKTVLDGINSDKVTHWDAAYSHSQIGVAATTPSGNPHNTNWSQIYSASGNAKILTDYIADSAITNAKIAAGTIGTDRLNTAVNASLNKADTALQSSSIKTLTIQRNGSQVGTYSPLTAATININAVTSLTMPTGLSAGTLTSGGNIAVSFQTGYSLLTATQKTILDLLEYDTTTHTLLVKKDGNNDVNFAAYGEVTAGGVGSGGSGGSGIVALYARITGGTKRLDDTDTKQAYLGLKVNGSLVTPDNDGVFSINTSAGSVTSVGLSVPTGFSVSGSPVTSSGTLAISFATGYSLPTTAKQTEWDTAYNWGNHANAGYATQTWVKGSIPALVTAGGRVYNSGDDEGIIISKASNGFAGLILGSPSGVRSVFYLSSGNPFWRYNNGTASFDISHPAKTGTIALTSDIPTQLPNPYSLTFGSKTYNGSAAQQITKSDLGLGDVENKSSATIRGELTAANVTTALGATYVPNASYATSAGNADTLDGQHGSYYATASSLGNYLPLSGANQAQAVTLSRTNDSLPLIINNTYTAANTWLGFKSNGNFLGYIGVSSGNQPIFMTPSWVTSTIYHSGNCNNSSTPWSASSLTLNGTLTTPSWAITSDGNLQLQIANDNLGILPKRHNYSQIGSSSLYWFRCYIYDGYFSHNITAGGDIVATGDIAAGSDARWKHNIRPVLNGIDAIMKLQPSEWEWNSDNHTGSGLIAHQVQAVLPHLVKTDGEGYLHLTYDGLHAYEISAIQSHETRIERLERENRELRQQIQRLQINS